MRGMCFICFINAYINILILWNLNSLYYSATIHNYFQNYSSDIATRETILRIVKYRQINMSGLKKKEKKNVNDIIGKCIILQTKTHVKLTVEYV